MPVGSATLGWVRHLQWGGAPSLGLGILGRVGLTWVLILFGAALDLCDGHFFLLKEAFLLRDESHTLCGTGTYP